MKPLLPRVPCQETKTYITFLSLYMFCLTKNAVYSVKPIPKCQAKSEPSHSKQVWLCAPANQIFSKCPFLILYSLSYKSFLPSTPFCSSLQETFHIPKCSINLYCITYIIFFNHFLTSSIKER